MSPRTTRMMVKKRKKGIRSMNTCCSILTRADSFLKIRRKKKDLIRITRATITITRVFYTLKMSGENL